MSETFTQPNQSDFTTEDLRKKFPRKQHPLNANNGARLNQDIASDLQNTTVDGQNLKDLHDKKKLQLELSKLQRPLYPEDEISIKDPRRGKSIFKMAMEQNPEGFAHYALESGGNHSLTDKMRAPSAEEVDKRLDEVADNPIDPKLVDYMIRQAQIADEAEKQGLTDRAA